MMATKGALPVAICAMLLLAGGSLVGAQRGAPQPQRSPRAAAPIDLTGYWVSVVTQDWRWRMVTPARGDYLGVPMTPAARKIAEAWDPARDEAAGEQCKSYAAPALMGVPGRLRISWEDDDTLKIETDAGMQTRRFHFGDYRMPPGTPRTWQGVSVAQWQTPRANTPLLLRPAPRVPGVAPPSGPRGGSLKVVTTHLRPGYLRKNGVPFSENTVLTEYFDTFTRANGDQWLIVTTQVEDPVYLTQPRLVAYQFKKEPNGDRWEPTPCSAIW